MTHDQHIASDPGLSAWVSASAGTGKTKVLTDRVLRLLLAGNAPARILCITYTKAAAAEMETRISERLARWATLADDKLNAELAALTTRAADAKIMLRARRLFAQVLDAPQRIRIQTIHSFCQSVLMRFPLEADVPPHFTAIDEITSRELLLEARGWLMTDAGREGESDYGRAIAELSVHISEASLNDLITGIITERQKFAEWLDSPTPPAKALYEALGLEEGVDDEALLAMHMHYTPDEEQALRQACAILSEGTGKTDSQTFIALEKWLGSRENIDGYTDAFVTDKGTPRKVLYTKAMEKRWPLLAEVMRAEQARVLRCHEARQTLFVARMSGHVTALARAILERYQRLKSRHGYLDYDDLILSTARLLYKPGVAPWVLYKLDGGIDHLLIDEAQDTAPEQWRIAEALAAEFFAGEGARDLKRTLFVVGDEKQSIYSFQGADPHAFDAMQLRLSKLAEGAEMAFRRVRLALSFRSTEPVLKAVDAVFTLPQARDGLIFHEADIRHEVHRVGAAGRVELWPLLEAPDEETLPAWHIPEKVTHTERPDLQLAQRIADTIAGWLKNRRLIASQGRPVTPGDIMILVQRRGTFAGALLRALKRKNIPVAGADRLMLTEHIAVMDCLSLARFLLLPQDDLTLAEVLRSPFIGLSEEMLFELAYARGEHSLWQRLKENPACRDAHTYLAELLAITDYLPPYELFAHILERGGRRKLASRLGGEIDDPLNEFLALALQYGKIHPPSLQGFLHWVEAGNIQIKRDMEKGRDEVRILTVHGAKGLQAPIVFLPDTVRTPLYDSGILWRGTVPVFAPGQAYYDRNYRALKETQRVEAEREYRRLLYVAMTRAEDELYIAGWKGNRAIAEGCWYSLISLAAQGWEAVEDKRVLSLEQSATVKKQEIPAPLAYDRTLPDWVLKPAKNEPLPPKPLSPSRQIPTQDGLSPFAAEARERGILIHRLLQYLPEVQPAERPQVMARFIARYGAQISLSEQERLSAQVNAILEHPEFAPVFGPDSVAEASISGVAGGGTAIIAGRIDRLAILPHDAYIIDYKTGRRMPQSEADVPETYAKQIRAYRQLVAGIYPDKTIHCALLFTSGPRLMVLSDALLESLAA